MGSLRSFKLQAVIGQSDYKLQHCSTPTTYVLRPETRYRLQQSSQYDTFLSRALGRCFTRVAKMRRNTVTLDNGNWTIANLETCSFMWFNNAFRKTFLRAAKRETRKLTDHRKQLLSRVLISSRIVTPAGISPRGEIPRRHPSN